MAGRPDGDERPGGARDHLGLATQHLRHSITLAIFGQATTADVGNEERKNVDDRFDEEGKRRGPCIILPSDIWKEGWDLVILCSILYSAVMVPYRICFSVVAVGNLFLLENFITAAFLLDVLFNFNTAYLEDELWVTHRGRIAWRYLQGWFWIDAPASIPVELIDSLLEGDSSNLAALRFLRLFRLLRLLRLLKINEYVTMVEVRFDVNLTFLRIGQMIANMIFLAHMLGCFWFYMAVLVGIDPEITTWVSTYDDGSALYASAQTQYLYAVYWALTTLTTVGYGDITPTNDVERLYSLFALLTGALVFGYMLSSIGSLVAAIDRQAALSQEKIDELKEYMRWRRLPRDLVMRLRRYYTYYYSEKTAFDEQAILNTLTPALRFEIVQHSLKETIGKIPLFAKTLDATFQIEVFHLFKPIFASPQETIFSRGELSFDLYFLIKGMVEVISGVDHRVLYRVHPGAHFGESVLTGRRRSATHRAARPSEMFVISADDLSELFSRRPREGRLIHQEVLTEHLRKERMRVLSLRLLARKLKDERIEDCMALRLQLAWNSYCKRLEMRNVAENMTPVEETLMESIGAAAVVPPGMVRQNTMSPARMGNGARTPSSSMMAVDKGGDSTRGSSGQPPGRGSSGVELDAVTMATFVRKVEKMDMLVDKLETLINATSASSSTPRVAKTKGIKVPGGSGRSGAANRQAYV